MAFDYDKPAVQILLDLIYLSNGIRFDEDELTFGTPQALDQRPDIDYDPNTFIMIHVNPLADFRYAGSTGVMYRRATLLEIPPVTMTPIPTPAYPFTTYDLLPAINAHYAVQLTEDDVVNSTYTDEDAPLVVTMLPSSLCYQGSATLNHYLLATTNLTGFLEYTVSAP